MPTFLRVVPIGYLWDGANFVVCTATNAPKVAARPFPQPGPSPRSRLSSFR